jgi:hypothetical protein
MTFREKDYQRLLAYGIDQLVSIVFPGLDHRAQYYLEQGTITNDEAGFMPAVPYQQLAQAAKIYS